MAKKKIGTSAEYWRKRGIEQEQRSQEIDDYYLDQMQQELATYQRSIIKDIEAFYGRYAKDNGMTYQEAMKYLTDNERKEFQNVTLKEFEKLVKNPNSSRSLVDALAYRHRISRKEALLAEVEAKTMDLFGKKDGLADYFFKNTGQVYGEAKIDIARGMTEVGINLRRPILDLKTVKNKLRVNWSGKNLSKRIWGQAETLYKDIEKVLDRGLQSNWSLDRMIDDIVKRTGVARSRVETLVRTESNAFNSMGALDGMKEQGVEYYRNVVTYDSSTSERCQEVHHQNKSYKLEEYEIGTTAPPYHPRCRTIIVPDYEDEFDYFQTPDPDGPTMDDVFDLWEEKLNEVVLELEHDNLDEIFIETENERKPHAINVETKIDTQLIHSLKYSEQFEALDEKPEVIDIIRTRVKQILKHRSGTLFEDLVFIDSQTGDSMIRMDYNVEQEVSPSKRMKKFINALEDYSVIAIHNHPKNSLPSFPDLINAKTRKYKYGLVVTHNGLVYKYSVDFDSNIDETIYNSFVDKFEKREYNLDFDSKTT